MLATSVVRELKKSSNAAQAKLATRFFKTAKGEYGYGDKFIGTKVPIIRKIARKYQVLSLSEIEKLTTSKFHEARLCGLIIVTLQFKKSKSDLEKKRLFDFYLKQVRKNRVNNWDLIDFTAPIMGAYLIAKPNSMQLLKGLAKSRNLWQRRSAILFIFAYLRVNQLSQTIAIVKVLLNDDHDLIQKTSGWALREVGKKDILMLKRFLGENYLRVSRTTLRYSIEKLSKSERTYWLTLK